MEVKAVKWNFLKQRSNPGLFMYDVGMSEALTLSRQELSVIFNHNGCSGIQVWPCSDFMWVAVGVCHDEAGVCLSTGVC